MTSNNAAILDGHHFDVKPMLRSLSQCSTPNCVATSSGASIGNVVRPDDDVNLRHALDQPFTLLLSHTTRDANHEIGTLAFQHAQPPCAA